MTRTPRKVRPTRASREELRRRRRSFAALVGISVSITAVLVLVFGGSGDDGGSADQAPSVVPAGDGQSELLAFSVTGSGHSLLAVVGTGGSRLPAVMVLPPSMQIVIPGQGEGSTDELRSLSGESMRIAVSNTIGSWIGRYAVTDLKHLGALVDSVGGLTIDLPGTYTVGSTVLGPGETTFSGPELVTFLYVDAEDQEQRWTLALQAILSISTEFEGTDLIESNDAAGAIEMLAAATETDVIVPETEIVAARALVPQQPEFDSLVEATFGTTPPVRAIVQNGSGVPGVGESVARQLIPAGFQIVRSQNAESFDHDTTEIAAIQADHQDDAERAREALGVGSVVVSEVPSTLADITIVVGKDYRA